MCKIHIRKPLITTSTCTTYLSDFYKYPRSKCRNKNCHILATDQLLPLRKNADVITQKCRIDLQTLKQLRIKPSSFSILCIDSNEFICQVWPSVLLSGNGIEVGTMVSRRASLQRENSCTIKPISVSPAKTLRVSLVLTRTEDVRTCRKIVSECSQKMEEICQRLLYKTCVSPGFVVDKDKCTLAKLHGVSYILIDDATDSDYCVVDNKTQITVNKIQSKDHYLQKQINIQIIPLGGLDKVIEELKEFLSVSFTGKSSPNSILRLPKGILLRGPPGTGKTSLVKHVCVQCNAFLISVNGPEVFGSRPGETEENIGNVFNKAFLMSEEGPCVVFLDEIDSVCPKRWNSEDANDSRCTSVFLSYLDQVHLYQNLCVIGATNRPSALDPSLRRPGRLDREVRVFEIYIQRVS